VASVPSILGAHTQAETMEELLENFQEVVELCLGELNDEERKSLPEFIGVQHLEVIF